MTLLDTISRSAWLAGRILRANVTRPDHPWKLTLALTYWCQYRCQTCNVWRRKPTDELTTAEIVEFVRLNPHVSWVDLTGGEIFLRPDIGDVFDAVVSGWRQLMVLHFPTNGFLTEAIVSAATRLAQSPVRHVVITVSVDGSEALNDRIRGIKGGFRRQVETFNRLREIRRIRAVFGVTQSRFNVGRFEETVSALQAECPGLTMNDVHLNVAQRSDHYYGNAGDAPVAASRDQALRELHIYNERRPWSSSPAHWLESAFLAEMDRFLDSGTTPMPCHSLRSSCFIDPWGTVFPCITYNRPVGSLRQTGMRLGPIWLGDATRRVQHEIWEGDCPQCWTACEAYQSILGNLLRPFPRRPVGAAGRSIDTGHDAAT